MVLTQKCTKNQVDYNSTCIDIKACEDEEIISVVYFNIESQETQCISRFEIRTTHVRTNCKDGYSKGPSGNCRRKQSGGKNRPKRRPNIRGNWKQVLKNKQKKKKKRTRVDDPEYLTEDPVYLTEDSSENTLNSSTILEY